MNTEEIKQAFERSYVSKLVWALTEKGYKEDLLEAFEEGFKAGLESGKNQTIESDWRKGDLPG